MATSAARLIEIYERLYDFFGPQHWWPADSVLEMLVGAVLTQNTNWQNVKKAIDNLRGAGLLSFDALHALPPSELADAIRPSGYFNLKAKRLKNLLHMLADDYDADINALFQEETPIAREKLLSVKGIGPETADSILLYGGEHPLFVIDAYTHRIFSRHQFFPEECDYQTMQDLFMDSLSHDAQLFNEYHALIVVTAKKFCRKKEPLCEVCPLNTI